MGHFLILFGLIFSLTANAVYAPGQVGTLQICGQTLSTTNLIHLHCRLNGASNRCTTARAGDNSATPSDYSAGKGTVGGANAANGKAFRVQVMRVTVFTGSSANNGAEPFYSDNDLGDTSAGSFTNGVNIYGLSNANGYLIPVGNATMANNTQDQNVTCSAAVNWLIPNGKFPGWKGDATTGFLGEYYGYEE